MQGQALSVIGWPLHQLTEIIILSHHALSRTLFVLIILSEEICSTRI